MQLKLVYPRWPKLPEQTEFHLPPHAPVVFAAALPADVEVIFVDENRVELDTGDLPDVVALSVMLTCQVPRAKAIAAEYRRRGVPVIAGGIAVMLHAAEMAQACDAVFLGEAEGQLGPLLDDLRRKDLRGVYDVMDHPPPTERIGPARRDILDESLYVHRGVRMLDLVHASRGCRFNCAPCAVAFLGGRTFRPRPIAKVVEEVRGIDNSRLFFVDNSLAQDREWEKELFTALIPLRRKFVSHPIEADDEVLDLAYRAGSWYVYQAILGISPAIRERVRRYHDHGIGVEGTVILGTDDHDRDAILRLLEFVRELELDMAEFTVLTPFPHTSYREQLEREGRILHDRWEEYTSGRVTFQPKHMSPSELQDLYYRAWDDFYGSSSREERMGRLFHNVVKRERADGTYVNRAAARRRTLDDRNKF